ncbi:MAG: NfeD family protein [Planctomycetota bacterium]
MRSKTMTPWLRSARACLWALLGLLLTATYASDLLDPDLRVQTPGVASERTEQDAPAASAPVPSAIAAVPSARKATNIAILSIRGEINAVTATSFERRLNEAVAAGADAIVVDLDTPGGEVGAVIEICQMLKTSSIANTVAWINPDAYSGGAIIALACREIVVAPGATMGDAAPVIPDMINMFNQLTGTERQKALTPILTEIVDSARRNGYDEVLVQAMVSLGVETWWIENVSTGERLFVTEAEYVQIFGEDPPRGRSYVASGGTVGVDLEDPDGEMREEFAQAWGTLDDSPIGDSVDEGTRFRSGTDRIGEAASNEISLGLDTPTQRPDFTIADPDDYSLIHYATDGRSLLTLKENDLKLYGFAQQTIATEAELIRFMGAQNIMRWDRSWSEHVVAFMTQGVSGMMIRGLLIIVFLLAMFAELATGGSGVFGIVAVVALAGLIVPPMLIGAATWWALAAIIVGIALLLIEVLFLPGLGIPGVAGLVLLLTGLVGSFAGAGQMFPGMGGGGANDLAWAVGVVIMACFAALVGAYFISKYTGSIPLFRNLVLATEPSGTGATASESTEQGAAAVGPVGIGAVGTALTTLRPSGTADFDGAIVDVVAETGYIEERERVRVTSVTEYRVSVEPAEDTA